MDIPCGFKLFILCLSIGVNALLTIFLSAKLPSQLFTGHKLKNPGI